MDAALGAAARALLAFDPLAALRRVALRDDAEALALRGVAMAQLGDLRAAQRLLGRAAAAFGRRDPLARARCLAARGEIALASRDVREAGRALHAALGELEARGDRPNALFVRLQRVRLSLLVGAVGEAEAAHRSLDLAGAPVRLRALAELVGADIATRRLDPRAARAPPGSGRCPTRSSARAASWRRRSRGSSAPGRSTWRPSTRSRRSSDRETSWSTRAGGPSRPAARRSP